MHFHTGSVYTRCRPSVNRLDFAAAAAAADPAVLLLDEITANLDAETEARVLEALRRASVGRTVLSVSHRIYENLGGRTVEIRTQGLE